MLPEQPALTPREAKLKSPVELAFVGDAVYELLVRQRICTHHDAPAGRLHSMCVAHVRAEAQHAALLRILPLLTEQEAEMARRGRNANKVMASKHASPADYRASTALETLFGFLFLTGQQPRMMELFEAAMQETLPPQTDVEQPSAEQHETPPAEQSEREPPDELCV